MTAIMMTDDGRHVIFNVMYTGNSGKQHCLDAHEQRADADESAAQMTERRGGETQFWVSE